MKKAKQKKYWFKRKFYGWGWSPASWEGWAFITIYIAILTLNAFRLDAPGLSVQQVLGDILPETAFLTILLIAICYCKGETPHWQWGDPDKKKKK